mmetsp:Transcript_18679/g.40082  ORF Transcript_18679/g.40082 Transcript_18679/m.40082 type:complete len:202 (-) Transcript_18679:161-766(-)|eukprot:CAMPEP_0172554064 /NCGR_PEP_ID=MMETSP1067-20121228/53026_1 /TAXON_ID=265564 ORGANISM="Thalassiosira punctigera, Strain Tpunct2005C2" /NCGR_SAMPLE_ID=MMETSP1067 /ASSEMBLY_ACC=CAM_ASM_000444 /LENGTH=201 /DNA_ID=CAMNT_0013342367 /DNA_START=141 /DNA_END=746 /DNA_ORIENTATION=+
MSDVESVAASHVTGVSRTSTLRSSKSKRKQKGISQADWRVIVRDSYAALFDLIGDWTYLYAIYHRDYDGDGAPDEYLLNVQFDYKLIITVVFAFCILSTLFSLWTIFTVLGRRCGRNSMCCNCTVPRIALATIFLEDLPQFVLTAYIDFTFSGGLTPAGMLNICSSLTALINRATTRYDEVLEDNDDDGLSKMSTVYEAMT